MHLAEIWRYPVKSMGGELLKEAVLGSMGIQGDRELYVIDEQNEIVTSREKPRLLLHHATVDADGQAAVDGLPWMHPEVAQRVASAAGASTRLVRAKLESDSISCHFSWRLTAQWLRWARIGVGSDPNLLIGGVAGLAERDWEGRSLRIGNVVIGLVSLRKRCIMTTWDPDTIKQNPKILRRIYQEFDGSMALNSWVMEGGKIAVGDKVELLEKTDPRSPTIRGRFLAQARSA